MRGALLVAAMCAAACGNHAAPPHEPLAPLQQSSTGLDRERLERGIDDLLDLPDAMCACRDGACAAAVDGRLATWLGGLGESSMFIDPEGWPDDVDLMATAALTRINACANAVGVKISFVAVGFQQYATRLQADACACKDAVCAGTVAAKVLVLKQAVMRVMSLFTSEGKQATRDALVAAGECVSPQLAEQALLDLRQIRTDACSCEDADCAERVEATLETWMSDNEGTHASHTQAEEAGEVAGEIQQCLSAARQR